jgi:hypothetical protein
MCARFAVLHEMPIAAAIAGCVTRSRNNNLDAPALRHKDFPSQRRLRLTHLELHLTICSHESDDHSEKHYSPHCQHTAKSCDSSNCGNNISASV